VLEAEALFVMSPTLPLNWTSTMNVTLAPAGSVPCEHVTWWSASLPAQGEGRIGQGAALRRRLAGRS
jgi:hypothetical protein